MTQAKSRIGGHAIRKTRGVVLGRSLSHDNSACIIVDGNIESAIAAERLTGTKHDHDNNDLAIQYCLKKAGLSFADVDLIVQNSPKHYFLSGNESGIIDDNNPRVWTISHHLAHAWAAFATSTFGRAVVVVIDGRGNFVPESGDIVLSPTAVDDSVFGDGGNDWAIEVESIYLAEGLEMKLLHRNRNRGLPASIGSQFSRRPGLYPGEYSGYYQYAGLGALYEQASYGIFGSSLDGGKIMGLAAFAKPDDELIDRIIRIDGSDAGYTLGSQWLHEIGGPITTEANFEKAATIASSIQKALELGIAAVMQRAHILSSERYLCYTGGVALNSCANEKVINSGLFDEVFIQPACSDAGIAVGCAAFGYTQILKKPIRKHRYVDFTGIEYDDVIDKSVNKWRDAVIATKPTNIVRDARDLLLSQDIIGWYRGGSELGPRALGHRSILSLPHPTAMKDRLNKAIKLRESFRPFAPIVPVESAAQYFEIEGESPYMLRVVRVRTEYRDRLEAITHVDGSARIQTLRHEDDPDLHHLLMAIGSANGIPVLLNTSFNRAGFPIVETPDDAIACFLSSGIDALVLHDLIIQRKCSVNLSNWSKNARNRLKLVPGVEIERCSVDGKEIASIRHGPRTRQISSEDADFLYRLESCHIDEVQFASYINSETGKTFVRTLLHDGWIYVVVVE